ncbi:MAG: tetratricopeptide repeat protein [Gammaproteobacteria bacterium]|nr:tetratricopeptide repeat protein [Gammaproteobacteria bacterium]
MDNHLDRKWNKAVELVRARELDAALFLFKSLAAEGEKAAYREIARIHEKQGAYKQAKDWYFKAIDDADDIEGCIALARLSYLGKGVPKSTMVALEYLDMIEANENHKAFLLKGRIHALEGNYSDAEIYYKKSYELGNIVALSEMASLHYKEGKYLKWILRKIISAVLSFKIARKDKYSEFIRINL